MITVKIFAELGEAKLKQIEQGLSPERTDPLMQKAAFVTMRRLIEATPKKTGTTRKQWVVERLDGVWVTTSYAKVQLWLEQGTKAHGPRKAKALYIPLKPGAMIWNPSLKFGRDYVLAKRVKGIKARHIVKKERPIAQARTLKMMRDHIRATILA